MYFIDFMRQNPMPANKDKLNINNTNKKTTSL